MGEIRSSKSQRKQQGLRNEDVKTSRQTEVGADGSCPGVVKGCWFNSPDHCLTVSRSQGDSETKTKSRTESLWYWWSQGVVGSTLVGKIFF